jgi:hypothetical protein
VFDEVENHIDPQFLLLGFFRVVVKLGQLAMATIDLVFQGKPYTVPKKAVYTLLNQNRELANATAYSVQSSVPPEVFAKFADSLRDHSKISVTKDNAVYLLLLANEFCLSELAATCAAVSVSVHHFCNLSERVSRLERSSSNRLQEAFRAQERGLEILRLEVDKVRSPVPVPSDEVKKTIEKLKSDLEQLKNSCRSDFERCVMFKCPMQRDGSMEGIIAYLARRYDGNLHDQGIVTMTSERCSDSSSSALKFFAGLRSRRPLNASDWIGEWVCWDFHEIRVRPTHYTLSAALTKSWAVEGSVDGESWALIDQQTDNHDLEKDPGWLTFACSTAERWENPKRPGWRFIRVTQTGPNHDGRDKFHLNGAEFFGTIYE